MLAIPSLFRSTSVKNHEDDDSSFAQGFVASLEGVPEEAKTRLMALTPQSYVGNAAEQACLLLYIKKIPFCIFGCLLYWKAEQQLRQMHFRLYIFICSSMV